VLQKTIRKKAAGEPEKENGKPKKCNDPQCSDAAFEKTVRVDHERQVGQKHA
jgi:hypothetical protein